MNILIEGFHTCAYSHWNILRHRVPFQCRNHSEQWLGVGYYFWIKSDYFAHRWGEQSYNNSYTISKFLIEYPDKDLLDLVNKPEHETLFMNYVTQAEQSITILSNTHKSDKILLEKLNDIKETGIKVCDVFWFFRKIAKVNDNIFPYKLVLAYDKNYSGKRIHFTSKGSEKLGIAGCHSLIKKRHPRIQLVLYPEAQSYIKKFELHYEKKD